MSVDITAITNILASSDSGSSGFFSGPLGVGLGPGGFIGYILLVIGLWPVFSKAGVSGFWAIIPFVNVYFLVKISGSRWWFFLLYLIPIVQIIPHFIVTFRVAAAFGKGALFFVFLALIPFIGYLVLGYGSAQYTRPVTD